MLYQQKFMMKFPRIVLNYIIVVTRQTNAQEYENDFYSQMKSEDRWFNKNRKVSSQFV